MSGDGTRVEVRVELKPGVVDAEAMATKRALDLLGVEGLKGVRLWRTYELDFDGLTGKEALRLAEECVEKLLANPVIHTVSFHLKAPTATPEAAPRIPLPRSKRKNPRSR